MKDVVRIDEGIEFLEFLRVSDQLQSSKKRNFNNWKSILEEDRSNDNYFSIDTVFETMPIRIIIKFSVDYFNWKDRR